MRCAVCSNRAGVAGICDPDYGALLLEPETPLMKELFRLILAFSE